MLRPRLLGGTALLVFLVGLSAAEPEIPGYTPVVPPQAVHGAVQANLKTVQDWLDEKDFASAAQAAQGLNALAQLYLRQGSKEEWRTQAAALAAACTRLGASARSKDPAGCATQMKECRRLLDDLAGKTPGPAPAGKDFKPTGNAKTWMLLLDASYSDAKTARDAREMEQLAYAIAEEMNAAQYLRSDKRWRQSSVEVRTAALAVANRAKGNDLSAARAELKRVYQRCEACHQGSRR
jgi:cytochrome c556